MRVAVVDWAAMKTRLSRKESPEAIAQEWMTRWRGRTPFLFDPLQGITRVIRAERRRCIRVVLWRAHIGAFAPSLDYCRGRNDAAAAIRALGKKGKRR